MIIDHNRSLPKSGSPHLSTPNKSPSPLPHKPTPQQTAKSQQVHTHQSDESTTDTIKTETAPSDPLLAMVHRSINISDDDASDISNVVSVKRSHEIQVCQHCLFQHANHTNQQLVDRGANGGLAGSDMRVIPKTSDGGKYEISKQVTDLLCSLFIQDYQSEPYHQHQNKAENRFGLAKGYTNTVMNTSGCPACCWLLCLQYICVVLNHLASPTLKGICAVHALEGTTPDISFMLHFSFYEPVYYRIDSSEPDLNFPSSSNEKKGYWVGFADNQGDHLTWRILTEDTQKIIIRSGIQSAL